MVAKQPQRSVYRTAKGVEIDMFKMISQNEMAPAVGNMKVNARGDKLGPNGQIIKTREEAIAGNGLPNQINVRQAETPAAPVQPTKGSSKKDLNSMDPEGNE
jgi:hypothetical protein